MYQYKNIKSLLSREGKNTLRKICLQKIVDSLIMIFCVLTLVSICIGYIVSLMIVYSVLYSGIGVSIISFCTLIVVLFTVIIILKMYLYCTLSCDKVVNLNLELGKHVLEFNQLKIKYKFQDNDLFYTVRLCIFDKGNMAVCPKIWKETPYISYVFRKEGSNYNLDLDFIKDTKKGMQTTK